MILAYLLLLTGLTISAVAIYYSVVGLAAIFSAAVVPIIVMGSALEVAKLVCASWLKANWTRAPRLMKIYMTTAVAVLMLITSMGIFGFLSKAHSDQSLVSGDVMSKISIYDEKIKIAKENIDANRKALKQMDEAVDQVMGRSQDEKGADKAVAIRRGQAKERTRLLQEIAAEQKVITQLNEERAPIAAEVRKVEAEVGPLKYIAAFVYGETDETVLEKAVTWVIITIIVVFDPLAVIMLLAAQMTFAWHNKNRDPLAEEPKYEQDDGPLTNDQVEQIEQLAIKPIASVVPYKFVDEHHEPDYPQANNAEETIPEVDPNQMDLDFDAPQVVSEDIPVPIEQWNAMIAEAEAEVAKEKELAIGEQLLQEEEAPKILAMGIDEVERPGDYLTAVTGDRIKPDLTEVVESEDSKKKSYMTKDNLGHLVTKTRE